jgi:hypothetical protein
MSSRAKEHEAWNEANGLPGGAHLALFCPRCATPHRETLTSEPSEPDYLHHVHQCHACGLRFDVFVRCRGLLV